MVERNENCQYCDKPLTKDSGIVNKMASLITNPSPYKVV